MNFKSLLKNKRVCATAAVCLLSLAVIWTVLTLDGALFKTRSADFSSVKAVINGGRAVNFYLNDADGIYYAFLPSYASLESSFFQIEKGDSLNIENSPVKNGSPLSRFKPDTRYKFSFKDDKNTAEGKFIIKISKNLPAVFIDTRSGNMEYVNSDKANTEPGTIEIIGFDGSRDYSGILEYIKGRGNSSWGYPKKPYNIKLEEKGNILGMGKEKDWVLISNYADPSNIRNKIVLDCARDAGLLYTPESRFTDLYLNGEYAGLYLLSEKIKIGENRIDITDLEKKNKGINADKADKYKTFTEATGKNAVKKGFELANTPADITGGYLFELEIDERFKLEPGGYCTERGQSVVIKEPAHPSREEIDYISGVLQELEDAIYADDGVCPSTGKHFSEYIDIESWAKKYLIEEVFQNYDSGITSQFFYKNTDKNGLQSPVFAGPVWDYDLTLGNNSSAPTVLIADKYDKGAGLYNRWFSALCKQPEFHNEIVRLYKEYFSPYLKKLNSKLISDYESLIKNSAEMNNVRWNMNSSDQTRDDIGAIRFFISEREPFLTDIWVNKTQYCDITFILTDVPNGRNGFFAVKKGDCFVPNYGFETFFYDYDWTVKETGERFDINTPITKNLTICGKSKPKN